MNSPIQTFQPPNPPAPNGDLSQHHLLVQKVREDTQWATNFTQYMSTYMNQVQNQLNNQVQGVGADIASATTIAVSSVIQRVTGTTAVQTITPPPAFSGPIFLLSRDGFSFTTGGNIANAISAPANSLATLVYTPQFSLWWVTSITVADGSITTAKLAHGAASTGTPVVDSTSQNITPYDTWVTVATSTVTINAASDFVHITGRTAGTVTNCQSGDQGQARVTRDGVVLDTNTTTLTLSTTTVVGGASAGAFAIDDNSTLGLTAGSHTYAVQMLCHNGSGNATFTLTKTSCWLLIVDLKAQ